MLSATALAGIKNYIKDRISYAVYTAGGITYTAQVSADVLPDGRIAITFIIDDPDEAVIVTEVALYDITGSIWASKAESIAHQSGQDELYRFVINVSE